MLNIYPVDEYVAFAPMPRPEQLPLLASQFDTIIAVVEEYELEYSPESLPPGVRFVHIPVPDYRWPSLRQLLQAARLAAEAAAQGRRVLIHCLGGRGRSATVAAGYLIHRYHMPARRVVEYLRAMRPGAVEHPGQEGVLRSLEALLAAGEEAGGGDWEELRIAGMVAEALHNAGIVGAHGIAPVVRGDNSRIREAVKELAPDAARLALVDIEPLEAEKGRYVVKSFLTGYSPALEHALTELAEAVKNTYPLTVRQLELAEPEYW